MMDMKEFIINMKSYKRQKYTLDYIQKYRVFISVNTKKLYNIYTMLDQRRRRWADVVDRQTDRFIFDQE